MQKMTATRTQWRQIIITICIGISTAFYIGKVPPALPFIRSELEMDLVTAGWVVSIFNALGTIIGIAVGLLADRIGPGRVITVSLIILPLASVMGSFSDSVGVLLCSRVRRNRLRFNICGRTSLNFPNGVRKRPCRRS